MAFLSEAMTLRIEGIGMVRKADVLADNPPAYGAANSSNEPKADYVMLLRKAQGEPTSDGHPQDKK